jgi:hypothetical protein
MSARDPDDLLRDGGGEIGDLYRRLPRYEPPRRLDRAVLNEAARAVHSGRPPRRQRWILGVGSAAGLVLAAGLAWRIGHEPVGQNDAVAPPAAPRVVPVQPIDESARAKREAPARDQASPPAEQSPTVEPQQAAGALSNRQDQLKAVRKQRAERRPASPPLQNEAPPPAAAAVPAPKPFPSGQQELGEQKDAENPEAASAGLATQAPGPAADKRAATSNLRGRASPTLPSSSVELQRDMQLAPPDWLAHIRDLMQQGRRQQATESLRLFVRAHPEHRVPPDLRELLD